MLITSRTWMIVSSLVLVFAAGPLVAQGNKTDEMLSNCRWIESLKVEDGDYLLPRTPEAQQCWGAFNVIQTVFSLVDPDDRDHMFHICLPVGGSNATIQLIGIFVAYAKKHPEEWNEYAFLVAQKAATEAFPRRN
jgi:hypothetical protein